MKYVVLIGRILFSSIFIVKSFSLFSSHAIHDASTLGMPMPMFFVPIAGLLTLLGGLSILLGYKARLGAWLLVIALVPITLVMHRFWAAETDFAMTMHNYCFWKNISMLGAALMITYFGSGPMSIAKN